MDPCGGILRWAREQGRQVQVGDWRTIPFRDLDVITVHDVLEHLTRPSLALAVLRQALSGDGRLIVEMPDAFCPLGEWRRHLRPLQHICLYSESAAREMFRRCGLVVESSYRPKGGSLGKISFTLRSI
jgi:SAM-dependent methyltransferase